MKMSFNVNAFFYLKDYGVKNPYVLDLVS